MQDLERYDMDELFRKAAEQYPLKTGTGDWDDIGPLLAPIPAVVTVAGKQKPAVKGRLLLPVSLAITALVVLFFPLKTGKLNQDKKAAQLIIDKPAVIAAVPAVTGNTAAEKNRQVNTGTRHNKIREAQFHTTVTIKPVNTTETLAPAGEADQEDRQLTPVLVRREPFTGSITIPGADGLPDARPLKNVLEEKLAPPTLTRKNFYWGIAAGPQFNEVKGQGMRKTGLNVGLIGGYSITRTLSVEAALFFSRKFYSSDGKYFSMSKVGPSMPVGMSILTLEGRSTMLEFPVNLRQTIVRNNGFDFAGILGISSYHLVEETNRYHTSMNGTSAYQTSNYKNAATYLAATINAGFSFDYKIARRTGIRLQPYLQIPLKGIGVGSMPVTSAGIQLGILHLNR